MTKTMLQFKNLLYISLAAIALNTTSCGDYFDLNDNPNQVSNPNINSMLTTATHKAAMNSFNIGYKTAHYVQYMSSSLESSASDTYEVTNDITRWDALYFAMADAHDLISKSSESNAVHHKGIGELLLAYQLGLAADLWGSIPYTDAFGKVNTLQPKYDTEEQIYQTQLDLINSGIENLKKTSTVSISNNSDLIFNANVSKWIKTGYALKARCLNKISKKTSYSTQQVLDAIDQSMTSNDDNMTMKIFNGINPWAQVAKDNENLLLDGWLSETLIDHLNGTKFGSEDPRIKYITNKTIDNIYKGTKNGAGNFGNAANTVKDESYIARYSTLTGDSIPVFKLTGDDSPLYIITFPEIKLIEAEAALKANNRERAYNAYLDAIKAHFKLIGAHETELNEYINRPIVNVGKDNLTLKHIFDQKYIVTYLNPETWNDLRRYDYQITGFSMPLNAKLPNYIRRLEYPSTERAENGNNVPSSVSMDTKLWWDQ